MKISQLPYITPLLISASFHHPMEVISEGKGEKQDGVNGVDAHLCFRL
jgi:hypothetical protein